MVAIETIRDEPDREHEFEMLWECYLSGQMTEKQWQAHLSEDADLREWIARQDSSAAKRRS